MAVNDLVFNNAQTLYLKVEKMTQNRAIAVYADGNNNNYLTINILDDSGAVISNTEHVVVNADTTSIDIKRVNDTKAIIVFNDSTNNSKATGILVDIGLDDTVTIGDTLVFSSGSSSYVSVSVITETNCIVSFSDGSNNNYCRVKLLSISDMSLTEITSITITNYSTTLIISEAVDENNVLIVYRNENNQYNEATLVRVNGNSLTKIDTNDIEVMMEYYHNMSRLSSNSFIITYRDEVGPGYGSYRIVTINGDVLSTSEEYRVNEAQTYFIDVAQISENKVIVVYCGYNNNYAAAYKIINTDTNTVESEEVFETGIAYNIDITVMGEDKYFISYVDDYNQGVLKSIDFNTPPEIPTLYSNEYVLSTDINNPTIMTNDDNIDLIVETTDIDNDIISYKILIRDLDDNIIYESQYQNDSNFSINGLSMNIAYKAIGYAKDEHGAEVSSIVKYFQPELVIIESEFWFEETPQILHACDSKVDASGAGETLQLVEGWNKQGTACLAFDMDEKADNKQYMDFNVVADFTIPDNTLRFWYNFSFPIWLKPREERGITVTIYDTYDNWREYYISGYGEYDGGWVMMQLNDYDNYDDMYGSNMRWDLIRKIRIRTMINALNSTDNLWLDSLTLGSSYKVVSNGPIDLDLIAKKDAEEGWGIFIKENGIYKLTGTMYLGNVNSDKGISLIDNSEIIVTSEETNVLDGHHNIIIQKNANTETNITLGNIENNKGINGIYFLSNSPKCNFIIEDASRVNLYGCNYDKFDKILGHENKILINNTEFHHVNEIDIKSGSLINSALTNCLLKITDENLYLNNIVFKDNDYAIISDIARDIIIDLYDCIFISNDIDIKNIYTEFSVTIRGRGISNPSTTENNVIIERTRQLTLTDVIPESEIRIYDANKNELAGIEKNPADFFSYSYNYVEDLLIHIIIHKAGQKWLKIDHTLSNTDESVQVHQDIDRNYVE